jgi:hypothetical protein
MKRFVSLFRKSLFRKSLFRKSLFRKSLFRKSLFRKSLFRKLSLFSANCRLRLQRPCLSRFVSVRQLGKRTR